MDKTQKQPFAVASVAFSEGGDIPPRYACEGENINPPLVISGIPGQASSLVILMEDPDAPGGVFHHWLTWNIPPNEPIAEHSFPGISGVNDFGKTGYGGPCPGSGRHRYFIRIYALDAMLDLLAGADVASLRAAMKDHVLSECHLMAYYRKQGVSR